LLQPVQGFHRRQHLLNARVRLAPVPDCADELAVLQLDTVHRNRHTGQIDWILLAVDEVVVPRNVGAVVADIAEKSALRTVVIERQRQRAGSTARYCHLDAHVHGDAELRMQRPLHGMDIARRLARLVLEQIDGVAGVMPEQMIGPASRLAFEIDVLAPEEESLHNQVLQLQLAGDDAVMYPLMRWIEAARVPRHRDQSGCLLRIGYALCVGQRIGDRNLDLDMLAGLQALHGLIGMHLGR
jgi:hypothetical protein